METKVVSTGIAYKNVPQNYIRPVSQRPNLSQVCVLEDLPVIDLASFDHAHNLRQIHLACKTYGFFQVINHGVEKEKVEKMLKVANEFFELPIEEKMKLYSDDPTKTMRLSTSFNVKKEQVHNWRDYLRLHCWPLDQFVPEWPSNPPLFNLLLGLSIFQGWMPKGKEKMDTNGEIGKEVLPDNEFEERIRPEVIPANEIGVTFADIGGLDDIKESLLNLITLPLRRPELFKGSLLKPCRGILLFGPPGTGKTMLAKAIANEAGASFINVSMSTITSKWFGEGEKNVRALFTLAAKMSPTIIFVDEVDSMLGKRSSVGEYEATRNIKNEFMTHWDGLLSKAGEHILVLAATNRPFDLDEAIIRRFERRIMVGLPGVENREKILKTLLSKEHAEEMDYKELATLTEGYTGSDLKNLCVTAAYMLVCELIQKEERQKDIERKKRAQENVDSSVGTSDAKDDDKQEETPIVLRRLNMEDMRKAKQQVGPSFATEGEVMNALKQWNELYGEGGTRKKEQLSYFL